MPKIKLEGYECERCEHQWLPRTKINEEPVICPKCKSPYWNRPRLDPLKRKAIAKHFNKKLDEKDRKQDE